MDPIHRLTKREVAARIRRSTRTVDNWTRQGLLPPPRRDEAGRPFWTAADFEANEAALTRAAS